jgi:hypothetical protein
MKSFIYLTVVLMIGFMLIGCAAVYPEQRKEHLDQEFSDVGGSPFVGSTGPEARSLSRWTQMSGY